MTPRQKFVSLVKNDILRVGDAALDFGIYRILNYRRAAIEKYLDETLPAKVASEIAKLPGAGEAEETRVYAALADFFSRYYEDGDFVMKARRGREAAYSVPYNGEDVHFHWATKGSHYVKSGLYFDSWRVTLKHGGTLSFAVNRADLPKDNNKTKDKKFFVPEAYAKEGDDHRVTFAWRALDAKEAKKFEGKNAQEDLLAAWLAGKEFKSAALPAVLLAEFPAERAKDDTTPGPVTLAEHLRRFTTKHNADFFVHPQLKSFLTGELDWFLKNEFLAIWDKDAEGLVREREKFKIAKNIGESLIDFLAAIEDVQAALFEKRRFVTNTRYLVMASRVSEELRNEAAANPAQVAEWLWWVGENKGYDPLKPVVNAKKATAKSGTDLLQHFPHLPIHTKHFDTDFTLRLLAGFNDLDAATGGLLVHSENYGALRTLEPTYRGRVKCVYIDPPYNTGPSKIIYNNEFERSSWLSLISKRLEAAKLFATPSTPFAIAIDDFEFVNLSASVDSQFLGYSRDVIVVDHHPQGTGGDNVSRSHEYKVVLTPLGSKLLKTLPKGVDEEERAFMRSGTAENNFRHGRPNSFFAILVNEEEKRVVGAEPPPDKDDRDYPVGRTAENLVRVYPRSRDGRDRVWRLSYESTLEAINAGRLTCSAGHSIYIDVTGTKERVPLPSNWTDKVFNAGIHGTNLLSDLFGEGEKFSYPKSIHTVSRFIDAATFEFEHALSLDFFAGSGTTGHAVLNLNREDAGTRKFMLVEMGEYFDSV
ncbi:MAG: site-specific DNA-methyltransferase, partial [Betaproteobacteria bacterium]|nr:site-specific DNA-methyltransferase [Betaproteobacteria bacterium]